jgi:hypothetical protein
VPSGAESAVQKVISLAIRSRRFPDSARRPDRGRVRACKPLVWTAGAGPIEYPAMREALLGVLLILAPAPTPAPQCPPVPPRSVRHNVVSSAEDPQIRIAVDPSFRFVGRLEVTADNICADRFVFAAARNHAVEKLFIVQFEALTSGATRGYDARITNRVPLANDDYQNDVIPYSEKQVVQQNPDGASAKTATLLKSRGYRFDDERIVSRFSRVLDPERRHRLLFLYAEPMAAAGVKPSDAAENGWRMPNFDRISVPLIARSLKAFKVLSERPAENPRRKKRTAGHETPDA